MIFSQEDCFLTCLLADLLAASSHTSLHDLLLLQAGRQRIMLIDVVELQDFTIVENLR